MIDPDELNDALARYAEKIWDDGVELGRTLSQLAETPAPDLLPWTALSRRQRRRFINDTSEARDDVLRSIRTITTEVDR